MKNFDLPHLRDGGKWRSPDKLPEKRAEFYFNKLKELGMTDIDAELVILDLYWDCYNELKLAEIIS